MSYYKNTTQTPNTLFDTLLKEITSISELKVLLTIIRKTVGQQDPNNPNKRLERAWISQRLFSICCNISGRAVSNAVDALVQKEYIEVTDKAGNILDSKRKRRGVSRLYYASRLRLEPKESKTCERVSNNPVNKGHTIKLNTIKLVSSEPISQCARFLSDKERFAQIMREKHQAQQRNR